MMATIRASKHSLCTRHPKDLNLYFPPGLESTERGRGSHAACQALPHPHPSRSWAVGGRCGQGLGALTPAASRLFFLPSGGRLPFSALADGPVPGPPRPRGGRGRPRKDRAQSPGSVCSALPPGAGGRGRRGSYCRVAEALGRGRALNLRAEPEGEPRLFRWSKEWALGLCVEPGWKFEFKSGLRVETCISS